MEFQMAGLIHNIAITRQITYLYHLNKKGLTLERVTPQRLESIKTILTTQIDMLAQERPLRTPAASLHHLYGCLVPQPDVRTGPCRI